MALPALCGWDLLGLLSGGWAGGGGAPGGVAIGGGGVSVAARDGDLVAGTVCGVWPAPSRALSGGVGPAGRVHDFRSSNLEAVRMNIPAEETGQLQAAAAGDAHA